jgi:4-cresol dehydrogenase (hydroxylating)
MVRLSDGWATLSSCAFDREDPQERARAEAAFRHLIAQYDAAGYPPGRMPTSFQEEAMRRLPQLRQVTGRIKAALDPDGVIVPGKYGIG